MVTIEEKEAIQRIRVEHETSAVKMLLETVSGFVLVVGFALILFAL